MTQCIHSGAKLGKFFLRQSSQLKIDSLIAISKWQLTKFIRYKVYKLLEC